MKRVKRHKIKQEMPETSTSRSREQEEHDLAYYIHDRVELMHQVFSVIKPKELKAMAPECVHDISVVDLQELCTEELLGISSKRLCAILDGADPPTDTESSSSDHNLETISLDSISSDDEVLSQHSSKKKHKHKKHSKKNKHKRKDSKADKSREEEDRSKASRAGLTVLELLELQARARAIRAQLQQDHASAPTEPQQTETKRKDETSEDEVEIKEEPAEVVEISSEDEKPKIEDLLTNASANNKEGQAQSNSNTVTKRINDLIVTVPQTTQSRKIVLNRKNKNLATSSSETSTTKDKSKNDSPKSKPSTADPGKADSSKEKPTNSITRDKTKVSGETSNSTAKTCNNKSNKKKKQKKKDNKSDKEEDHDEITLQLSDTEKMDLLEDLDRKNYDNFTSSSEDSESSSDSESEHDTTQDSTVVSGMNEKDNISPRNSSDSDKNIINGQENSEQVNSTVNIVNNDIEKNDYRESDRNINNVKNNTTNDVVRDSNRRENVDETSENEKVVHISEKEKLSTDSDNFDMNSKENIEVIEVPSKKQSEMKSDGVKDTSPSTDPTEDSFKINTVDISQNNPIIEIDANKSPDIVRERTKSPQNSIHKTVGGDFNINKNLDIEVEFNKSVEEVNTASEKPKEKITVIESIIIQVKNDNITETEQKETNKSMRSVVARAENQRTQSHDLCTENIHKANEKATEQLTTKATDSIESIEEGEITNTNKDLSEGEITDNEEETQTNNSKPNQADVVCVSEEDSDKRKKKKKKEKKTKKEKKSKKSKSDFREGADQNFYREADTIVIRVDVDHQDNPNNTTNDEGHSNNKGDDDIVSLDDDDDIYEILEISDDSSCYEVEGITVSKEPTAAEIAALSAKIDEINTDDVIAINEEDNEENAETLGNNENISEEIENISWRDRYLGSNKVKRVLTTSNILNALRKKNKELKRKLEESKKKIEEVTEGEKQVLEKISDFVEGSIEHFNTLQGSTKYVDPVVPEVLKENENKEGTQTEEAKSIEGQGSEGGLKEVTKEMEKDAKQLLKMYKRLLKYNDMNKKKEKDRNKKKKKKHKKNKDKDIVISEK